MAIVIAGPGRSGTSLLVKILTGCGFVTSGSTWYDDARAGLESRVQPAGPLEIFKDPWFHEYAEELDPATIASIDALIIPVRSRQHAVASRLVQDRGFQLEEDRTLGTSWRWRTGDRRIPGGIVVGTSAEHVSVALGEGLWDVLEWATRNEVPLRLVHFPRYAQDFAYFWSTLGDIVQLGCGRSSAEATWKRTVDPSSVRLRNETVDPFAHLTKAELVGLVERTRAKLVGEEQARQESVAALGDLRDESTRLAAQLEEARVDRERLAGELASIIEHTSASWLVRARRRMTLSRGSRSLRRIWESGA
jgi:hypothetical protein